LDKQFPKLSKLIGMAIASNMPLYKNRYFEHLPGGPMKQFRNAALRCSLLVLIFIPSLASAHGDVTPQPVDTKTLPPLGEEWRDGNPYTGLAEAARIGQSAYAQNCARCHGLQAKSGGIAPDLRLLDRDCTDLKNDAKKQACYIETDKYFLVSIRHGKVRNDAVYMPPFEGFLNQEAMWAIKTYLETLRGTE
jgi:cytochrome c-550 PedF